MCVRIVAFSTSNKPSFTPSLEWCHVWRVLGLATLRCGYMYFLVFFLIYFLYIRYFACNRRPLYRFFFLFSDLIDANWNRLKSINILFVCMCVSTFAINWLRLHFQPVHQRQNHYLPVIELIATNTHTLIAKYCRPISTHGLVLVKILHGRPEGGTTWGSCPPPLIWKLWRHMLSPCKIPYNFRSRLRRSHQIPLNLV